MKDPLSVRVLEDSESDAHLVVYELQKEGSRVDTHRVETEAELHSALQAGGRDVVIGDYNLVGFNGLAALQIVHSLDSDLPFIMVSGTRGEKFAVEAMRERGVLFPSLCRQGRDYDHL